MASSSSKRRKLDHDSASASETSDNDEHNEELTSDDILPEAAPARKQSHSRTNHEQVSNDSTLYAGGVYKSSMFKLQVDEMLAEVRPNYERRMVKIDQALHRLNSLIQSIEDRESLPVLEAVKKLSKLHKITVPFPDPKPEKETAYKLAYAKPSTINIIGSYASKTMVKTDGVLSIDMIVMMPQSIFQEKDFLNYRYFYKRAYYLACIAAGLQDSAMEEFDLTFRFLNGNSLHPVLVVRPKGGMSDSSLNTEVYIIPAAPKTLFAASKLQPTKNSIRVKPGTETETNSAMSSPFYNASIKSDCNAEAYLQLNHIAAKNASGYTNACILGRIWLRQRGFTSSISNGGFGNFEWTALTALLLDGGGPKGQSVLSPGYSSYQMFKAVLQFLAKSNLVNKPQLYEATGIVLGKSNIPIFYDGSRGQNILYKMSSWSYDLLREEARISIEMLNESNFDPFESTFILRTAQPLQRFDCFTKIPILAQSEQTASSDHCPPAMAFSNRIFEVLREGLMDRVKLIDIKMPELPTWSIKSSCRVAAPDLTIGVGVVFDPNNISRIVDHGPSAEDKKKAANFQKFWGEKAELRRFKDGSIRESLVWTPGSSYSIFRDIFSYLMKQHFGTEISEALQFVGQGFDTLLSGSASATKSVEALKEAYNSLEKEIRGLESLPLQLRQLSPVSPQLRYVSMEAPSFNEGRPLRQPADVLIHFEGSGRWPDDVVAIQRTKIAFLLKIGSLLQEVNEDTTTRLGLENEDQPFLNCAFLDIIYQSGAAFRLRIHSDREQTLLERHIKDKSSDYRIREDAVSALSEYKRIFIQLPLHSQSISTHCTRFPLLSPTIRLVKTWFSRHMLSDHISEELVELLVARVFLQPYPWRAPSSTMTGFLRTLLFISRWDWRSVPLVVDFTGTMTSKEVEGLNTRLEAWRKIDPGMNRTVICAGSNHDATGTVFTDKGPSKLVAARMTALARSACKLVKDQGTDLNPACLFASSTTDYDFVIHLSSKFAGEKKHPRKSKFKNLEVQLGSSEADELVGYRPVQRYVDELEKVFSNCLVFFHSATTGRAIGGLWNPQNLAPRPFKVNLTYATRPAVAAKDANEDIIELDKAAILAEISRLGGDLVSRIEVQR